MPTINDEEFGKIVIRRNIKSTQVKVRVAANGTLQASLPAYAPLFLVKRLLKTSRKELRKLVEQSKPIYDYYSGMQIGKSHTLIIQSGQSFKIQKHGRQIIVATKSIEDMKLPNNERQVRDHIISALKLEAKSYLPKRLKYLAQENGFDYKNIRFSHASGRWGSCNTNGTISLNIAIMKLPFELIDYVIVHELSHTMHMNHSTNFWLEVAKIIPDYKIRRKQLKTYSPTI